MTPPRILLVEFPFGNPVYIAAACTVVAVTREPIIAEAIIVVQSVRPLPEHITRHAAGITDDRATKRPRLAKQKRRTDYRPAPPKKRPVQGVRRGRQPFGSTSGYWGHRGDRKHRTDSPRNGFVPPVRKLRSFYAPAQDVLEDRLRHCFRA
jgi:hypothetical protein